MPRAKKVQAEAAAVATVAAPKNKRKVDPFDGLKIEDCLPYTNDEDLPMDEVLYKKTKDNMGRDSVSRKIYCGEPRFFLEQNMRAGGDWWNLIGRYRNGKGVGQRNVRTMKPKDETRLGAGVNPVILERIRNDNKALKQLLEVQKIPVQVKRSVTL